MDRKDRIAEARRIAAERTREDSRTGDTQTPSSSSSSIGLEPRGHQREVLYLPTEGHYVVLGSAGSGKSTVAVLRSSYLADPDLEHAGRVLLVTFTQALTKYLRQLVGAVGNSVDVKTLHSVGRQALSETGAVPLYDAWEMNRLQAQAINNFKRSQPKHRLASRPTRFFKEEFEWIAGHGVEDKKTYLEVERVGRASARLLRADRESLFYIYREYLQARHNAGYHYDLQDMPHQLHLALKSGVAQLPYRHVIIDEAQDFPPEVLRAASLIIPSDGSLTVFADYAQQIYGHRMSWRSAGLRISRLWELNGNYRNTRPIARVAAAIAALPGFEAEDILAPPAAHQDGPTPTLSECANADSEDHCLTELADRFSKTGNVAVLVRTIADRKHLAAVLPPTAQKLDRSMKGLARRGVFYGTLHAAKGLEFDSVVIARCSADRLPNPRTAEALGIEEARAEDLRLIYVGVTRARRNLVVTYVGAKSPLIPSDEGLFAIGTQR